MLRIITWDEGCKPSDKVLDAMKWDTKQHEPGNAHPATFLAMAQHRVKVVAKYPNDLFILLTVDYVFFNALRVALRYNWTANEVYSYESNGMTQVVSIDKDGRLEYWPGVFNVEDMLLDELLKGTL